MRMHKGMPFRDVKADGEDVPTFSEKFLYEAVGRDEARFILGVADEYDHVIKALGPSAVCAILDVKPRLAQRLGLGEKVVEWLADANSDEFLRRELDFPGTVMLDHDAAHALWGMLHREYERYFAPEEALSPDLLRAYHGLTDSLGAYEQGQRRKEQERAAEKRRKQDEQIERREREKAHVKAIKEARRALVEAVRSGGDTAAALAAYDAVMARPMP